MTYTPPAPPLHTSTVVPKIAGLLPYDAVIAQNHFKFKSLSDFAFNTSVGCMHGCKFCFVPSLIRQPDFLHKRGVEDPDAQWGQYQFVRNWDVKEFLTSLRKAENTPRSELTDYGKRVIILCSTTDGYSVLRGGDLATTRAANAQLEKMVREALELILTNSTLRVRILTRSPLAERDFDLMKRYGNRLLFGMSIATLNDKLAKVYEPGAPAPSLRLRTLQRAKAAGIPVYVAMAPTPPECTATDLRTTLSALKDLDPVTIFHEPINIRAENAARIATCAAACGVPLNTGVFDTMTSWRAYAIDQLRQVEAISKDLGVLDLLHLWPDANLKTAVAAKEQADPQEYLNWVESWHNKVSAWPC